MENKIDSSDIYNFYAVIGSLPQNQWYHFMWLFKRMYNNLMDESYSAIQKRVLGDVAIGRINIEGQPHPIFLNLDEWTSKGGSPKVWRDLYKLLRPFIDVVVVDRHELMTVRYMGGKIHNEIDKMRKLTPDELGSLFNLIEDSWTLSKDGRWYKNKNQLDAIVDSKPREPREVAHAVDLMIQMSHHNASFLEHTASNYRDSLKAVNAKFNASDASQYWDFVDDYVKASINKIRRTISLPIILQSKVSRQKLFAPARKNQEYKPEDIDDDINHDAKAAVDKVRNLVDMQNRGKIDKDEFDRMIQDLGVEFKKHPGLESPLDVSRRLMHKAKWHTS
jgi:hypothetical protein